VAVPAAFQAHLLREDARAQLVLLAEVNEPYARSVQLFDQLHLRSNVKRMLPGVPLITVNEQSVAVSHHIRLRLVLHSDHPDENLIALNFETAFDVADIVVFIIIA